ncbi:UPSTREAM OF FLC protein [Nymphaea thermarum]|nr:UPSTREAM OF FLC protein [Nymphaea thermarum]
MAMSVSPKGKRMEVGVKKPHHRQNGGSPEGLTAKVSPEAPPRYQFPKRVPVVYYLYRNRHLEHPHFIEVPLSSSHGLFLRDFIERLNVLRGKGMPALYSWSCKRSYKNGFVWHDLCEDDLIYPTNGNEYILKGSELLEEIPCSLTSGLFCFTDRQQHQQQQLQQPPPVLQTKQHQESSSASTSSSPGAGKLSRSSDSSPSTAGPEYKLFKAAATKPAAADVATQTSDPVRQTCSRGVSTEEPEEEPEDDDDDGGREEPVEADPSRASPPPCSTSSGEKEKPETLESLISADRKLRSFRYISDDSVMYRPESSKPRVTDMLMQLISCGSISVKDHGFGLVPTYRSRVFAGESRRFGDSGRYPWRSGLLCELDSLCENPRLMGIRLEDKEYFSGSLLETKKRQEEGANPVPSLKRCSSYNAERNGKSDAKQEQPEEPARSKCIPRTIKSAHNKLARSPLADNPRKSSARYPDECASLQNGGRHITEASSSERKSSKRFESFREGEKDKIIKIEES